MTKPVATPEREKHRAGEIDCDENLFEKLRELRKRLADERAVPPYIVFSDVSLRQMARHYPATERDFEKISGVGERKLREFGKVFLKAIRDYLASNPRQIFADDSLQAISPSVVRARLGNSARETLRRFQAGESAEQIAASRSLSIGIIYGHLADALAAGEGIDLKAFMKSYEQDEIAAAFKHLGFEPLSPVYDALGGKYDYGRLKLVRATMTRLPSGSAGVSPAA